MHKLNVLHQGWHRCPRTTAATRRAALGAFPYETPYRLAAPQDHMYGSRIVDIKFHSYGGDAAPHKRVISSDTHIVKVGACESVLGRLLFR